MVANGGRHRLNLDGAGLHNALSNFKSESRHLETGEPPEGYSALFRRRYSGSSISPRANRCARIAIGSSDCLHGGSERPTRSRAADEADEHDANDRHHAHPDPTPSGHVPTIHHGDAPFSGFVLRSRLTRGAGLRITRDIGPTSRQQRASDVRIVPKTQQSEGGLKNSRPLDRSMGGLRAVGTGGLPMPAARSRSHPPMRLSWRFRSRANWTAIPWADPSATSIGCRHSRWQRAGRARPRASGSPTAGTKTRRGPRTSASWKRGCSPSMRPAPALLLRFALLPTPGTGRNQGKSAFVTIRPRGRSRSGSAARFKPP